VIGVSSSPGPLPPAAPTTICEATCARDGTGAVEYGAEIDFATAVARRTSRADIVVRGDDLVANRDLAKQIEARVGPVTRPQLPHANAGPLALPHFHQVSRIPSGHSFYETSRVKARKKK